MKVHVVRCESFVMGVFSTPADAQRYAADARRCGESEAWVEEHELDAARAVAPATRYYAAIDLLTGEISRRVPELLMRHPDSPAAGGVVPAIRVPVNEQFGPYCPSAAYAHSWVSQGHADDEARRLKAEFERLVLGKYRVVGRQQGPYLNVEMIP